MCEMKIPCKEQLVSGQNHGENGMLNVCIDSTQDYFVSSVYSTQVSTHFVLVRKGWRLPIPTVLETMLLLPFFAMPWHIIYE